jgi:hypothetical protein
MTPLEAPPRPSRGARRTDGLLRVAALCALAALGAAELASLAGEHVHLDALRGGSPLVHHHAHGGPHGHSHHEAHSAHAPAGAPDGLEPSGALEQPGASGHSGTPENPAVDALDAGDRIVEAIASLRPPTAGPALTVTDRVAGPAALPTLPGAPRAPEPSLVRPRGPPAPTGLSTPA